MQVRSGGVGWMRRMRGGRLSKADSPSVGPA